MELGELLLGHAGKLDAEPDGHLSFLSIGGHRRSPHVAAGGPAAS
jgi:hypothetical protein